MDYMTFEEMEIMPGQQAAFDAQVAEWEAKWPNYCKHCKGWGEFRTRDWVPYGSGNIPMDGAEPCEHCTASQDEAPQLCARCMQPGLTVDGEGPCIKCGWNYNDGLPEY